MPRPAVALVFGRVGPVVEGRAEELDEAPEAIDMPVVLWHMARCTGAEDFAGGAECFEARGIGAAGGTGAA